MMALSGIFPDRAVRIAAFLIWVAVGVSVCLPIGANQWLIGTRAGWWGVAFVTFGLALWGSSRGSKSGHRRTTIALVAVQSAAALVMGALACSGLEGVLLVITTAQLPALLPFRRVVLWTLVQTALFAIALNLEWPLRQAVVWSIGHLGLQLFALAAVRIAVREGTARRELARLYAELRATHGLLIDGTRTAERLRISRDLHDVVGHHLTALSLNLEVATHAPPDEARAHTEKARSVAKLLLKEVRDVVGALRHDREPLDLARALQTLVEGIPAPRVHLTLSGDLRVEDPALAQTIVHLVQEIVTNAMRHADAANLWIELSRGDDAIHIQARDDGRGTEAVQPGYGLSGMRERLGECGGRLEVASSALEGFRISASLPLATTRV